VKTVVHGTCVALGGDCALLRGAPGAGKSDLALRFLFLPSEALPGRPALVADDQVILRRGDGSILASCPRALSGKIEVRGIGIVKAPATTPEARLTLIADLDSASEIPRFPEGDRWETVLDVPVRHILLNPFELSAPLKLALALQNFPQEPPD